MNIKPFEAVVPDLTKFVADDAFFNTVREQYSTYVKKDFFFPAAQPAIYIYEITTPLRKHLGVIAALDLNDYRKNKVKKHEKTLLEKEKTQMSLLLERGAMVKPVLLTHVDNLVLQEKCKLLIENRPIFHQITFVEAKETHRFWQISDLIEIQALQNIFQQKIPLCYVADGHHRLTANLHFEEISKEKNINTPFDEVFCAFFAASELQIDAFNRALQNIDFQEDTLLEKIHLVANAILPKGDFPSKKGEWATCINRKWYYWEWKTTVIEQFAATKPALLDVDLLNEKIFIEIFGIEDVRKDKRIIYVEGNKGRETLEKLSQNSISFELYPVDIQDLMLVADANAVMPPKSTWFEPRMRNGVLVQEIPKT